MSDPKSKLGLVQVYTGDGKGKTTATLGLALRAVGQGLKVYLIQFLKGAKKYGEHKAIEKFLIPYITVVQTGRSCVWENEEDADCQICFNQHGYLPCHISSSTPEVIDYEEAEEALKLATEAINGGEYNLVILDEIGVAMNLDLIKIEKVAKIIREKPKDVELVLTGRNMPKAIQELADYVSEIQEIKHPYKMGIKARLGIEF